MEKSRESGFLFCNLCVHDVDLEIIQAITMSITTSSRDISQDTGANALFLAVRLYCSFVMEFDLHTLLDSATLVTTLWVIYMIRFKLRRTYMEDKDNFAIYYGFDW